MSQNMEPTPRLDRISKDYKKEYPSIEVEGRRTLKKKNDQKNIENVKLDGEVYILPFFNLNKITFLRAFFFQTICNLAYT